MHPLLTRHRGGANQVEPDASLTRAQMEWMLEALCRTHGLPFDAEVLRHEVPPWRWSSLPMLAEKLGLRCVSRSVRLSRIPADLMPCLVLLRDATEPKSRTQVPAMVVRVWTGEVLYLSPGEAEPRRGAMCDLAKLHTGGVLLAMSDRSDPVGAHVVPAPKRIFGFRRLIPNLLRLR